jgi:hypothetical protein
MNKCHMLRSHVFKFKKLVDCHVYECATALKAEQRASLHLCRNAPCSGDTAGTMPSFCFLWFFKIIMTTMSRPIAQANGFFDGTLDLARSKGNGQRGARGCCLFKAPSTYASAATVRRLAGTARVLRPLSDLFSKAFK